MRPTSVPSERIKRAGPVGCRNVGGRVKALQEIAQLVFCLLHDRHPSKHSEASLVRLREEQGLGPL